MVAPVEADDDSKEFADFRHNISCFIVYARKVKLLFSIIVPFLR